MVKDLTWAVTSGVLQGSVLGYIFFFYINGLSTGINSDVSKLLIIPGSE